MPLFDRLVTPRHSIAPELVAQPLLRLSVAESAALAGKISQLAEELNSNRPGRNFCSMAIFMEIIVALCRSAMAVKESVIPEFLIGDAIRYMHDHLEEPIEIRDLLKVVNMSRRSFFAVSAMQPAVLLENISRSFDFPTQSSCCVTRISPLWKLPSKAVSVMETISAGYFRNGLVRRHAVSGILIVR